jgi:2-amino-4-hydroxy-6-hydroxymethyldihydropteridine diphosphokinase
MQIAYLLTGGNRGDSRQYLQDAMKAIGLLGQIQSYSTIYQTDAWGYTDQEPFLNQAISLETDLSASDLLKAILEIERSLGRVREEKYGPRTIDIDILLFGDQVISQPDLKIPHPQLPFRRFALQCLNDIAPDLLHPMLGKTMQTLLEECTDSLTVHKLP